MLMYPRPKYEDIHIRGEEVHQSVCRSGQGEGADQKNGEYHVWQSGRHVHRLKCITFSERCTELIFSVSGVH